MKYLAFIIALILPITANALCVSQTSQNADEFCINLGNGFLCEQYADLTPKGNLLKQAVLLGERLQAKIDERVQRTGIVFDEPTKNEDPKTGVEFWGDVDGNAEPDTGDYMITRCAVVSVAVVNEQFIVTISRP